MFGLKEMMLQEKKYLESLINKVGKDQREVPEGRLRLSADDGKVKYYHCIDDRNGTYISKSNFNLACQLAQKAYDNTVMDKARKRLDIITNCLKDYSDKG